MADNGPSPTGNRPGDTIQKEGEVMSVEEVNRRLAALGINRQKLKLSEYGSSEVSKCARAAIQRGFIELKGESKEELNQVIWKGKLPDWSCDHPKDVKLWEVLYQPDNAGTDNELRKATVFCDKPDCQGREGGRGKMYLTSICTGEPRPNNGRSHNHCQECPGFGICIKDYRNIHCCKCNEHFFGGEFYDGDGCPCQGVMKSPSRPSSA